MRTGISFTVLSGDGQRLRVIVADPKSPQKHVWRAQIILLSGDGLGTSAIIAATGKSKTCVWRWQERFMYEGVDGLLYDKTRPRGIPATPAQKVAEIVRLTLEPPPHEATHWTLRAMAARAGLAPSTVQGIWKVHGLSPHRWRAFKLSNDPAFVEKLTDVVGLYVDPPDHAVVLSVDEKSQIQVLDRTQPGLPMKKGRAGTMTHDWHDDAVCGARRAGRDRGRAQHATPPPSGVHPLPQRDRARHPRRQGGPRDPRQRLLAQNPRGAALARTPCALDRPFRPHKLLLAERGRGGASPS